MHVVCRPLREELYRAYLTRASSGETDNTPLIERTLALRQEQAQLLGYPNYAEVSLASKVGSAWAALGLSNHPHTAHEPALGARCTASLGAAQCRPPRQTWRCFRLAPVQSKGGRCSSVLMMPFNLHSRAAVICRIQCVCSRRRKPVGGRGPAECREYRGVACERVVQQQGWFLPSIISDYEGHWPASYGMMGVVNQAAMRSGCFSAPDGEAGEVVSDH